MRWLVRWEIELEAGDANTPTEAAQKALDIMRDPNSSATVFDIFDNDDVFQNVSVDIRDGVVRDGVVLPLFAPARRKN